MPFKERRKYPRVSEPVACCVCLEGSTFTVATRNLSCGGALFQTDRPIAWMTKLAVTLTLPAGGAQHPQAIRCQGVVVRQEPLPQANGTFTYQVAVYFSQIQLEDRRRIAEFVLRCMLAHDRRRS